ncbi:MAG: DUF459 domain-containing protein [Rhodobacteraceae bacterium]|nr:DUF459 domain-containing protein [Paracoccaceae bacterium]
MWLRALILAGMVAGCNSPGFRAGAQDIGPMVARPATGPQLPSRLRSDISAERPARILVIGDSLADGFGMFLKNRVDRVLPHAEIINRGKTSTGLARRDFYDWPAQFAVFASEYRPDIVVAHFGANDMQTVMGDATRTVYGTAEWDAAYLREIRKVIAVAQAAGVPLYWIGPAPDSHSGLNAHLRHVNPLFAAAAQEAGAIYFPLSPLVAGHEGEFVQTVKIEDQNVTVRSGDGSHFTGAGYTLIADNLLADMAKRFPPLTGQQSPLRILALQ